MNSERGGDAASFAQAIKNFEAGLDLPDELPWTDTLDHDNNTNGTNQNDGTVQEAAVDASPIVETLYH